MKKKDRKKVAVRKEEDAEDWCFVCKDGGELRICDYKQCLKSYHPNCVGKEDTFLGNEDRWCCAWHYCMRCQRSSNFHCYTCTAAVCRNCLPITDFVPVKKEYGFCNICLKLAFLIEENKNHDSDGETVDFTDRETVEGLYMEYYVIIKDQEGFEFSDLHAAENRKNEKIEPESDSEEFDGDEEEEIYGGDSLKNGHGRKRNGKESRSVTQKSAKKTPNKCNKAEFIGWASRPLIEFLAAIGRSSKEELSQREVASIINDYVKENKLQHPNKKKQIICDAKLQNLFRKKTMGKHKVYGSLEPHFLENIDDSEEDELSDNSNDCTVITPNSSCYVNKRQKVTVEKTTEKKDPAKTVPESCFAAIVVENVKLVYLKRLVLYELLKQPESFNEKVTGSVVRIKSNPDDYTTRNSHQLVQVTGIKEVTNGEIGAETILLLSSMPREISINLLTDGDIKEEECDELRVKMLAGELKRPTVGELLKKAKLLHKDITHFMIKKELNLVKNLIERANEKGWRRQLFEYLERRDKLQSPSEQAKLLEAVPTVIPDLSELDSNSDNVTSYTKSDECPS